jgi:hypothetical protein
VKVVAVVSALDLRLTFGATSARWQLLKGLAEVGIEVVVTRMPGDAVGPRVRAYLTLPSRGQGLLPRRFASMD